MKFIVESIVSNTDKSNLITYQIIDTCTKLDGCTVKGYAPKSVNLQLGYSDIPYFIAKGIFGFNRPKNIKSLEKQLQAKAPKGEKRAWRAEVPTLFEHIAKLNVEEPEEPRGEYAGKPGDALTIMVKECKCVYSNDWMDQFSWRHNGNGWEHPTGTRCLWKITDMDERTFMFSTSGEKTNEFLSNLTTGSIIETKIDHLGDFHGLKQTWITRPKKAKGLFELLG